MLSQEKQKKRTAKGFTTDILCYYCKSIKSYYEHFFLGALWGTSTLTKKAKGLTGRVAPDSANSHILTAAHRLNRAPNTLK